jgi:stage IV sporulation protein FB
MKKPSIYIEPLAPAGIFVLLFVCENMVRVSIITSVIVHEAAHLLAAIFCKEKVRSIRITPFGITLGFTCPKTYKEEAFVALCGPLASIAYAALGYFRGGAFGTEVMLFSAFLGAMNLLPFPTFDGFRILHALFAQIFGCNIAERIMHALSLACLFAAWTISIYILFYSGANFALLLFCAYIFAFTVIKKDCIHEKKMVQ